MSPIGALLDPIIEPPPVQRTGVMLGRNDNTSRYTAQSGRVLTMAKKAILDSLGLPLREGVRNSMKVFLNEFTNLEDSQEGLRATVEKRAPKWKKR